MRRKVRRLELGPVVKGCEGNLSKTVVRIWGQGSSEPGKKCVIVAKILQHSDKIFRFPEAFNTDTNNIGIVQFTKLTPGTKYYYQMGYYFEDEDANYDPTKYILDWEFSSQGSFTTSKEDGLWSFVFGSCRKYIKIAGLTLYGTGKKGDKIYRSIMERRPDFFMSIGDQVYFDPVGSFGAAKSLDDMREIYKTVRSMKHVSNLMANCTIYEMCDDHDIQCNDACWATRTADPESWNNGVLTYFEYQHLHGPLIGNIGDTTLVGDNIPKLYYQFNRQNASFFVMDTRTERDERTEINGVPKNPQMISDVQMEAVRLWVNNPEYQIKFLVSPTPLISQVTSDTFNGFPLQQKELCKILMQPNVFVLVGNAHCARVAKYHIPELGWEITEIISSGLVATEHRQGKPYDKNVDSNVDIAVYNMNNSFPFIVDNRKQGGLQFVTTYASSTFPKENHDLSSKIVKAIRGNIDNVYVNVLVDEYEVCFEIFNQNGTLLHTEHIFI